MENPDDFRPRWLATPVAERRSIAKKMGTSYAYLQRISGGFATPSLDFALRLQAHFPGINFDGFKRAATQAGKRAR